MVLLRRTRYLLRSRVRHRQARYRDNHQLNPSTRGNQSIVLEERRPQRMVDRKELLESRCGKLRLGIRPTRQVQVELRNPRNLRTRIDSLLPRSLLLLYLEIHRPLRSSTTHHRIEPLELLVVLNTLPSLNDQEPLRKRFRNRKLRNQSLVNGDQLGVSEVLGVEGRVRRTRMKMEVVWRGFEGGERRGKRKKDWRRNSQLLNLVPLLHHCQHLKRRRNIRRTRRRTTRSFRERSEGTQRGNLRWILHSPRLRLFDLPVPRS